MFVSEEYYLLHRKMEVLAPLALKHVLWTLFLGIVVNHAEYPWLFT